MRWCGLTAAVGFALACGGTPIKVQVGDTKLEVGNVEPDMAFSGACDVLVSDGFTGNILLKTAEGTSRAVARFVLGAIAESDDPAACMASMINAAAS